MIRANNSCGALVGVALAGLLALPTGLLAADQPATEVSAKANRWEVTCYLPNGQVIVKTRASSVSRSENGETFISQADDSGKSALAHALYGNAICSAQ